MSIHKTSDGFIVFDLPEADTSVGLVRSAPKILQSGAEVMARSYTYIFASRHIAMGGASAAVNAKDEERTKALAKFTGEISDLVSQKKFLPVAGAGVSAEDLHPIRDSDPRMGFAEFNGVTLAAYCTGLGAVVAVSETVDRLENRTAILEGFNSTGVGAAYALANQGAKITGLSTSEGFVSSPDGIEPDTIKNAWREHRKDMVKNLGLEVQDAKEAFKQPCDVFFAASKMGVINHVLAESMDIKVLASLHPAPFTTRALAVLTKNGVTVLPDFLCLGGFIHADWPPDNSAEPQKAVEAAAFETLKLMAELKKSAETKEKDAPGLFLAACEHAESYLRSWQPEIPFGRPLAI